MPAAAGFIAFPRATPAVGFGTGAFGTTPFGAGADAPVVVPPSGPPHGYVYATVQTRGPRLATLMGNGQVSVQVTSGVVTATVQT